MRIKKIIHEFEKSSCIQKKFAGFKMFTILKKVHGFEKIMDLKNNHEFEFFLGIFKKIIN